MSSTNTILSIREMIDLAFGDPDMNVVNHKLIQTILYLLARQLRILERRVEIEIGYISSVPETSLSVTEIKVHAIQEKSKKKKGKSGGETRTSISKTAKTGDKKVAAGEKSATQDSLSATDQTTTTKSSSDKTSSDKTVTIKSGGEKDSSSLTATDKSLINAPITKKIAQDKKSPEDPRKHLELIEETREKELRVIHQVVLRADSREVQEKSPTPMASLNSIEAQYEKLLVVERVPSSEAKAIFGREQGRTPRLSVVTQEQFMELANVVKVLENRFAPIAPPGFPDNLQFMQELRRGASLTNAMAALQLSARLEAAEKTLSNILSLITELATQTGVDLSKIPEGGYSVFFGLSSGGADRVDPEARKKSRKPAIKQTRPSRKVSAPHPPSSEESDEMSAVEVPIYVEDITPDLDIKHQDTVTYMELDTAVKTLYDEIMKKVTSITSRSAENANNAYKLVTRLEGRLDASLNLENKMEDLETLVSNYATQINILDTSLSSQMTNYQEQLTQMQHDLEIGLETMTELLANAGGDTTAVAELSCNFSSLQLDFDIMAEKQKELKTMQSVFSHDLKALWDQIEHLKATKSDRDEVADALRDKAGIGALNGLVSLQQFDAVRGDYEKRIGAAYSKFNNQEIVWQKAIDDVLRELNEKADWVQLISLKEDITKNLNNLHNRINVMMEIVGEPRAAAVTRKVHRDAACISCSTPAHMALEEPGIVPALPAFQAVRLPAIGAEAPKPKEDGDHDTCYPGQPIPHPRDPRAHVCNRYCGGSHTAVNTALSRAPVGMIIRPALRQVITGIGSDGKTYIAEQVQSPQPCILCNKPKTKDSQPSPSEQVVENDNLYSDMVPSDFRQMSEMIKLPDENLSVTPPAPFEDMN